MITTSKIGFIGAGNMGSCLLERLIQQGHSRNQIWVIDHHEDNCKRLQQQFKISCSTNYSQVITKVDILVLAVKPQSLRELVREIAPIIAKHPVLLISIAAGITTEQIQRWLNIASYPVVRAMPNTPALIGAGITGLYATENVLPANQTLATALFRAVGETVWIPNESLMDVVTALSASGPGYLFYIMETLIKAAIALGLSEELARKLTIDTVLGSANLALHSQENLGQLRDKVTSKGGTTEQGIKILKDGKLEGLLAETLAAATARAKTLSEQYD